MAKTTPMSTGEVYIGENPAPLKTIRVKLGFSGQDVNTGAVQATYHLLEIDQSILVENVQCYTPTAWTTSVTINIGDSTTTNGWIPTATVAPTSAQTNGIVKDARVATATYAGGKLYAGTKASPLYIDAVVGGANPAVGETDVYITYREINNL